MYIKWQPLEVKEIFCITDFLNIFYFGHPDSYLTIESEDEYEILYYLESGSVIMGNSNNVTLLNAGQAFFTSSKLGYKIKHTSTEAVLGVIGFKCNYCSTHTQTLLHESVLMFGLNEKQIFHAIIESVKVNTELSDCVRHMLKASFERLLILLYRKAEIKEPTTFLKVNQQNLYYETILDIVNYMVHHIYENLSLNDISEVFSISASYIKQLFSNTINRTPMEYYLDLKINIASRMILESDISFTRIAEILAFNSYGHFFRTFKMRRKMTPSEYKKMCQNILVRR